MKSARDKAIDIVWQNMGRAFSRSLFCGMLADDSDAGRNLAGLVLAIERGIEQDRREVASLRAPS